MTSNKLTQKEVLVNDKKIQEILEHPSTKDFYEKLLEKNTYVEIRVFIENEDQPRSFYATNLNEIKEHLYVNRKNNCYIGINPRKKKGKSSEDVAYRRFMVFDLESIGKKPSLKNKQYQNNLKQAINFIKAYVSDKFGMSVTAISKSGAGIHIWYRLKPLDVKYQENYELFYNKLITALNNQLAQINLKIDPPCKDLARVFGAIGSKNNKYKDESAYRKLIYYEDTETDIEFLLATEYKPLPYVPDAKIKLSLEEIRQKPEYQIFKYGMIKGTGINNKARFPLSLLMRNAGFTLEETNLIAREIQEMGYPFKNMFVTKEHYKYYENTIQSYCFDNYEWCIEKGFAVPYVKKNKNEFYELPDDQDFPITKITQWNEVIDYVALFNKTTRKNIDGEYVYFPQSLLKHLKQCCVPILYKFIEQNNLIELLKYKVTTPKDFENNDVSEFINK